MPATLRLHPSAVVEARAARRRYSRINDSLGRSFGDELELAFGRIADHPLAYEPGELGERRALLRRFPFSVVFIVSGEHVDVVAVAHHHRRPGYWREG